MRSPVDLRLLDAAGDRPDEAMAAARDAARRLGVPTASFAVLHRSNNVVVRSGDVVFKVGSDLVGIGTEVEVARHAARAGGPVLAPLADAIRTGPFAVSVWPYRRADRRPADDVTAAAALRELHRALAEVPLALPPLGDRFAEVRGLLDDDVATAALPPEGRATLRSALDRVISAAEGVPAVVLHAEPHDGNRLSVGGMVVYLDLEAVCTGPLEWDLAYVPDEAAQLVWPDHDRRLRRALQLGVSTCVSAYCWRHVTSRPEDGDMRWHARHHLGVVEDALRHGQPADP